LREAAIRRNHELRCRLFCLARWLSGASPPLESLNSVGRAPINAAKIFVCWPIPGSRLLTEADGLIRAEAFWMVVSSADSTGLPELLAIVRSARIGDQRATSRSKILLPRRGSRTIFDPRLVAVARTPVRATFGAFSRFSRASEVS
jgi:hypothetical protein